MRTTAEKRRTAQRGEAVERFLETEQVKDLWSIIEADLYALWGSTASEDEAKREELYRELHGLRALKARLRRMVQEGKRAKYELDSDGDGNS